MVSELVKDILKGTGRADLIKKVDDVTDKLTVGIAEKFNNKRINPKTVDEILFYTIQGCVEHHLCTSLGVVEYLIHRGEPAKAELLEKFASGVIGY